MKGMGFGWSCVANGYAGLARRAVARTRNIFVLSAVFLLLVALQATPVVAVETELAGWGPLKFGMTPNEVANTQQIPLMRQNEWMLGRAWLFKGQTRILDINFEVDVLFTNIAFPGETPEFKLSEIVLDSVDNNFMRSEITPCKQNQVYTSLVEKYGNNFYDTQGGRRTDYGLGSMGASFFIWEFPHNRILYMHNDEMKMRARECSTSVGFMDNSITAPKPPQVEAPKSNF